MADNNGLGLLGSITGLNAGIGLAKSVFGAYQAIQGSKQLKNLLNNRPQYNISQGYLDAYKTYQSLANSQLPGYNQQLGLIGESTARANTQLERGAMGSNQFMSGALQTQDKELDAIKNLGLASAQWRAQQQQGLAGAQQAMGGLQDQAWDYNVNQPWQMKANMANENRQAGMQNLWGGVGDASSSLSNFAGTSAYLRALQSMQPQGGNGGMQGGNRSLPIGTPYSPQQNLNNTVRGLIPTPNFNNG